MTPFWLHFGDATNAVVHAPNLLAAVRKALLAVARRPDLARVTVEGPDRTVTLQVSGGRVVGRSSARVRGDVIAELMRAQRGEVVL